MYDSRPAAGSVAVVAVVEKMLTIIACDHCSLIALFEVRIFFGSPFRVINIIFIADITRGKIMIDNLKSMRLPMN